MSNSQYLMSEQDRDPQDDDPAERSHVGSSDPAGSSIEIEISDVQGHLPLDPEDLAGLARRVLLFEGVERGSISIALVDDATIHALNRRHLDHDWPTDVISFRLSEPDELELNGELIVSTEMAARTAEEIGANARDELALYVVHGLLHLCGMEDQTESGAAAMRRRESEILSREGLANTFPLAGPLGSDRRERGGEPWSA